jgi:hypothetical protein
MTGSVGQPSGPARYLQYPSSNSGAAAAESRVAVHGNSTIRNVIAIVANYRTCEFTTVFRDGTPLTWPVSARFLRDGRFLLCTSIGFPQKAFNIWRNPKVSLLFSEPTGSELSNSGAVLVCGDAVAQDRVISDMTSSPEMGGPVWQVAEGQPASKSMSSFLGRQLFPSYYWRIAIYVQPVDVFYWRTRHVTATPEPVDVRELRNVATGR